VKQRVPFVRGCVPYDTGSSHDTGRVQLVLQWQALNASHAQESDSQVAILSQAEGLPPSAFFLPSSAIRQYGHPAFGASRHLLIFAAGTECGRLDMRLPARHITAFGALLPLFEACIADLLSTAPGSPRSQKAAARSLALTKASPHRIEISADDRQPMATMLVFFA
jgi:hypothetical protein